MKSHLFSRETLKACEFIVLVLRLAYYLVYLLNKPQIYSIMLKQKYQSVLDLGEKLNIQDGDVTVQNCILNIKGIAGTPYEKNLLWDAIKSAGGENPSDLNADIDVRDASVYHRHIVKRGETLGGIAKHYYGNALNYKQIFRANSGVLKNPDTIYPDQELVIPNL